MSDHVSVSTVAHQFDDREQQKEAGTLGMWLFLGTEILFFGGLFTAYTVYRWKFAAGFAAAHIDMDITLGAINTAVLLLSSLTMALGVRAAQLGQRKGTVAFIVVTMLLGLVFLAVKGIEYQHKFVEGLFPGPGFRFEGPYAGQAEVFFTLYFMMTGLHALHMIIGVGIMTVIAIMAWRGKFSAEYYSPVEISGLYWHFVDIVWIFLFPLLYLIHPHS
ncbi:MAG: cytochrome c oxidase subunit 3 family protein [Bacteroidota bacterium]